MTCGAMADRVRRSAADRRLAMQTVLARPLARAVREGELPADVDPSDLAGVLHRW